MSCDLSVVSSVVRVAQQVGRITFKFQVLLALEVIFEKTKPLFPSVHKFISFAISTGFYGSKKTYGHMSSF